MTRLFAFGCSFTNYDWPTWADIMGRQFDQYFNYGKSGGGNQFIFNSIVEANLNHKFNDTDTIAIMWTNVGREDRYLKKQWLSPGNIYIQHVYDKKFTRKFIDERGYYIRDLASIWAINQLLEQIKCKFIQFSMVDMTNPTGHANIDASSQIQDLLPYYQPVLDKILPSVHKTIFNYNWDRPNCVPSKFVIEQRKNLVWKRSYENIRDSSWPDCNSPDDFYTLPIHIQKECIEQFGLDPGNEKSNLFASIIKFFKNRNTAPVLDKHPTPLEHLQYLDSVLPDLPIDTESREWVGKIDSMLHGDQNYASLWTPNKPARW